MWVLGHVFNIRLVRLQFCLYLYFLLEQSLRVRPRLCQVSLWHKHRLIHVCGFIASQAYVWASQRLYELRISQLFLLSFCGLPIFALLFFFSSGQPKWINVLSLFSDNYPWRKGYSSRRAQSQFKHRQTCKWIFTENEDWRNYNPMLSPLMAARLGFSMIVTYWF